MANFTSNTYRLKRKILTFTNKISRHLAKPEKKFAADITYGMLASNTYKKGYHVTEVSVLTTSNHPVSIFSRIHSSSEKDYKSTNTITFNPMKQGAALFGKATFAMDRGYDDNKMFLKMEKVWVVLTNNISRSTMNYIKKGVDIMAFSIRLSEEEKGLADSYAKLHSLSLGEAFKKALFEKIEDEYDIVVADEAYKEYVTDGKKSRPISDLWKECEL